jgi:glutamate formiminotransferase / formiminotetrahydrofolate cyclodeaminase
MQEIHKLLPVLEVMVDKGNPNSASDGGVGMLCARAAMHGAWMNVRINASGLKDKEWLSVIMLEGEKMVLDADAREKAIMDSLVGKL